MKKILIIVGGKKNHLKPFLEAGKKLGVDVSIASFSELSYELSSGLFYSLKVSGIDLKSFDIIYIRLVGKRFEELALLADYAKKEKIKLVDSVYQKSEFVRLPYPKSLEIRVLNGAGLPTPFTIFGTISFLKTHAPRLFGTNFVIKDTVGKQGHGVWSPRNKVEFNRIFRSLYVLEKEQLKRFLVQEFIKSSQRTRVLVIGGKAVAAITRPTKWRKRFTKKINGEIPGGVRKGLNPIPKEAAQLAVKAAKALSIDIAGVDLLHDDTSGKAYILEVNSAPRWKAIKTDTGVNVEEKILAFLAKL